MKSWVLFILKAAIFLLTHKLETGHCISPTFVWSVINSTIEKKMSNIKDGDWNPSFCPRIVFYDNETLASEKDMGFETLKLDVTGLNGDPNFTFSGLEPAKEFLSRTMEEMIRTQFKEDPGPPSLVGVFGGTLKRIRRLYEPCITVISIVNSTELVDFDKLWVGGQISQLLQYHTPVRNRHLILVRLALDSDELFNCNVFRGSREFPMGRMPLWEMLLFDYFTDARVIQGIVEENENKGKNSLKVGNDPGLWVWMCDDIVELLERKKRCIAEGGEGCTVDEGRLGESLKNCSSSRFSPRH